MYERLIQEVVEELKQRMSCSGRVCVFGEVEGCQPYQQGMLAELVPEIVIAALSPSQMARLALAMGNTPEEEFILQGLLLGKPVIILNSGVSYRNYKQTSGRNLYNHYLQYERQLKNLGFSFVEDMPKEEKSSQGVVQEQKFIKKRVLTASAVIDLDQQGIKTIAMAPNTIITPLAQEELINRKIAVVDMADQ